uniref:GpcrRhopsn4 domain-containing protein n=1 Tax=Panagrellus redivivus TaxID=6233 RepID=A0A7E4UQ99_PANRE
MIRRLCFIVLALSVGFGNAKYSIGTIITHKNWVFLDKFCFVSEAGNFQFELHYPKSYEIQNLYMYYDTPDQWFAAYNDSLQCAEKERIIDPLNNQIMSLSPLAHFSDPAQCVEYEKRNQTWYNCTGSRSFFSMRPRWWFMAIGNCDSLKGLYLEYRLLMTNAAPNDRLFYHFSFDEFYTLTITMCFMVIALFCLVVGVMFMHMLRNRNMLHATYKIFMYSIVFEFTCLSLYWLHYDRFADDGIGLPFLNPVAMIFRHVSNVLFLLLLLLIGKGYTITRAKISSEGTIKLIVFMTFFIIFEISTLVWEIAAFDPAKVHYISESAPSYFLAASRTVAWLWFLRSCAITVKMYPLKRNFYVTLTFLISFWFLAGPIVMVFANFVLDNWVRAEVVHGVDAGVSAFGFGIMLFLTCPVQNNRYFPYHVRTNQVGDCSYPQNVYEVQYTANPRPTSSSSTLATSASLAEPNLR